MSEPKSNFSRRRFLQLATASAATTAGLGGLIGAGNAVAAEKLSPTDPTATALAYVEKAETTKDPAYKKGSRCDNCMLYTAAQAADGFAPCGAVGGKLVAAGGWCKVYTPKPA